MKTLAVIGVLAAAAMVAPAQAAKPDNGGKGKPAARPDKRDKPAKKDRCAPRAVGFNATGTLVSAALTAGEPRRFDGTLVVSVTRANHGAPKGEQTYTLADARVKFRRGVDAAAPAAGSRVKLHGTITRLAKRCPAEAFTPTVTVRNVEIAAAKPAPSRRSPKAPPRRAAGPDPSRCAHGHAQRDELGRSRPRHGRRIEGARRRRRVARTEDKQLAACRDRRAGNRVTSAATDPRRPTMPIAAGRPTTPNDVRASDARNHEAGLLLIGVGAILLLVSLFFEWYQRGIDAFEAFEVWDLVLLMLAVGTLAAVASRFGFGPPRPASWLIGPTIAALVIVLFALVNPPPVAAGIDDDASTGLWLALAATILMSAGALLSVARISVALASPATHPLGRRHAPAAGPADPAVRHADPATDPAYGDAAADPAYGETVPHRGGRRFFGGAHGPTVAEPADPVAPGAVPPTEPTRRI